MESMTQITKNNAPREDEYIIEFDDTRKFAVIKWNTTLDAQDIATYDRTAAKRVDTYEEFGNWLRHTISESRSAQQRTSLHKILDLANPLWRLMMAFERLVSPEKVDMSILWGLVYLNVNAAIPTNLNLNPSNEKLKRVSAWLGLTLRNSLLNLIQCVDNCKDDNACRMQLTDTFDPLLQLLNALIKFQRTHVTDTIFAKEVNSMKATVKEYIDEIDEVTYQFRELNKHTQAHIDAQTSRYIMRDIPFYQPDSRYDFCAFPCSNLPDIKTENFFGREKTLENINKILGDQKVDALRSYLIYGRRGVGKTQIALEYARRYQSTSQFDAVFWIQCETSASLRQSFADVAMTLKLPGAQKTAHFEENLVQVLQWLRKTNRTWLLIYDNAERNQDLSAYWPKESTVGSVLLTSRSYYNFQNQENRNGETIPLFNEDERWELLMHLLGPEWQAKHLNGAKGASERAAAAELLKQLDGLPLAIAQAAKLVLETRVTDDQSILTLLRLFKEHRARLPPRLNGTRDQVIHSLDTIWSIALNALTPNARSLLGVFSLLAPDSIPIDLFLPANQSRFNKRLEFCKQEDLTTPAVEMSADMRIAIKELKDAGLIRQDKQAFVIHRVIQEAMNFMDINDLQSSFDAATELLHEAFPLRINGNPLHEQWNRCQMYVQHVIQLKTGFGTYRRGRHGTLVPDRNFIRLLANCGWYLYEVADFVECEKTLQMANSIFDDKNSLLQADLSNSLGALFFDLNKPKKCREAWDEARQLFEQFLPPDDLRVAQILANIGNLETTEGNLDAAQDVLERASIIRKSYGEAELLVLGLIYLQLGRVAFLRNDTYHATKMYDMAEHCFVRKGNDQHFAAHLHYARGNLEFDRKDYNQAYFQYEKARDSCDKVAPTQPLAAHNFFKLACVEKARGPKHHDRALEFLEKANNIAELRSPAEIDGTLARIQWKKAEILLDDPIRKIEGMKIRDDMKQRLLELMEELDLPLPEDMTEDMQFDMLVPGYYR